MSKSGITPTRIEDFPAWYQSVIKAAQLAENSSVRGCMVIKPWGYAIWEQIQKEIDQRLKATGHENFYCPLFVPKSSLEKEAKHVDGFAKECAVVTHHRLVEQDGKLIPDGELKDPLVIRPTSEAIIGELYSNWIGSYRDLPLKLNQWANVVRWEMRPRLFLRTSEFLWQEGHTAHATKEEAIAETRFILDLYVKFLRDFLALPTIDGAKTESEKFPGADLTFTFEAMMQDGKALQAGTSHFLGQNFAKAFNIDFTDESGHKQFAWTTSWGITTRLIGAMIMVHGDDHGLVLPPKIAPLQVVIIPLSSKSKDPEKLLEYCQQLNSKISELQFLDQKVKSKVELKNGRPGELSWGWIKKGVPIVIEIGDRDLAANKLCLKDRLSLEKQFISSEQLHLITELLTNNQHQMLQKQTELLEKNTYKFDNIEEFEAYFRQEQAKFAMIPFAENEELLKRLKSEFKITPRCIPNDEISRSVKCLYSGKDGYNTIFARSY